MHALRLEAELRRYQERLRVAFGVGPGDRVLDIGCGAGGTTREAALAAGSGSALGVDLSAPVIDHARRLAAEEGLDNAAFECADAQLHPFPAGRFDLGISRFGTMFFADPVAAFANIARALRPGARLVQLVWQERERQEWVLAISSALGVRDSRPAGSGDPFSLADPAAVEGILTAAGFTDVTSTELNEPVYYGPAADAFDFVGGLRLVRGALAGLDGDQAERALDRLRALLATRDTGDGVWFDSNARLVAARRP
ncbi:methyltransferase [Actinophytocola xanthii]|uniref:Methyltransferase n=1 Tax=Actinophytocola xanthii TaxID=1912961 RepID=A0A1Q8C6G1_9PSEU|nr:methyltransferase [Actinophytocola xanthii]